MLRVTISEMRNRLSHYLRLVKGGEEIEIVDRDTPIARVTQISHREGSAGESAWVKEMEKLGIIQPPSKRDPLSTELLSLCSLPSLKKRARGSVLEALLEERKTGR